MEEKMGVRLENDGSLQQLDVKGLMKVVVRDPDCSRIVIYAAPTNHDEKIVFRVRSLCFFLFFFLSLGEMMLCF